MRRSLFAVAVLLLPLAAHAGVSDNTGVGVTVTLSANLDASIDLTIDGRTGDPISGTGNTGTVSFGNVTIDDSTTGSIGTDISKYFHSNDGSATWVAELDATLYFTGAPSVDLDIEGLAAGASLSGHFACGTLVSGVTWSWDTTGTFNGNTTVGTTAQTCFTFPNEGTVSQIIPLDLGLHLAANAPSGTNSYDFVFTVVAAP